MKQTEAIHCVGNGTICAYMKKADIESLFGSPYSSPPILSVVCRGVDQPMDSRCLGDAPVWETELFRQGEPLGQLPVGKVVDYALPESACLVRSVCVRETVRMDFTIGAQLSAGCHPPILMPELYPTAQAAVMIETYAGNYLYNRLPLGFEQFYVLLFFGAVTVSLGDDKNKDKDKEKDKKSLCATFSPGESHICFVSGRDYEEICRNTDRVLNLSEADMRQSAYRHAQGVLDACGILRRLSADTPRYEEVRQAILGTVWNLTAQQERAGGVLAGSCYRLGYVRDQYGVARGMLALGLHEEAKKVLRFFMDTYTREGKVRNAQGYGVPHIFHPAENDEVEMTAYLILLARCYVDRTGDTTILPEAYPMLLWAYHCLVSHFHEGMVPFNGDETYIAGGILPRSCLLDGSAEGTMLFAAACEALIAFQDQVAFLPEDLLGEIRENAALTRARFAGNFMEGGVLYANNPAYRPYASVRFTYGICDGMGRNPECHAFDHLRRTKSGNFLCPNCMAKGMERVPEVRRYALPTVTLMSNYTNVNLTDAALTEKTILEGAIEKRTGRIVGYDYGLTLYNLVSIGSRLADTYYDLCLDAMDECLSWPEYYSEGAPVGCRYRPWESAVNIEGILSYLTFRGYVNPL